MIDFIKKNKIHILVNLFFILISISSISFGFYEYFNKPICDAHQTDEMFPIETEEIEPEEKNIYVEIKGAVKKAGVYEVSNDKIINDIVNLAGGFDKSAYTDNINLSKKVSSEMVIYVYTKTQYNKLNLKPEETKNAETVCITNDTTITDCIETGNSVIEQNTTNSTLPDTNITSENIPETKTDTSLININTATKNELMNLSGIGESKANNIINYRTENGMFKSIEDIKNVSGIGDAVYEQIKANITV